jgi:WD40 repeat protein
MYWSLHDNNILCSFIGHTDSIISIDLNPADSSFVSQSKDNTTRVWEYEKKICKVRINKSKASCFDNTGMILACLFIKGTGKEMVQQVHLFNTENYEEKPFSIFQLEDAEFSAEIR